MKNYNVLDVETGITMIVEAYTPADAGEHYAREAYDGFDEIDLIVTDPETGDEYNVTVEVDKSPVFDSYAMKRHKPRNI